MKNLILIAAIVSGCAAPLSTTRGSSGNQCYTWGDAQGLTHVTCAKTKQECKSQSDETDSRDYYQTLSTCETRR